MNILSGQAISFPLFTVSHSESKSLKKLDKFLAE